MDEKNGVPIWRVWSGALMGIPFAILYGVVTRWLFGVNNNDLFIVMTLAFILFVPLVLGLLTVWVAPASLLVKWHYAFFLSSRHQLSTHFNAYAGIWTDAVMRDLQDDILAIVRDRSEAAAR
jgi:hypothetical protein